MSKRLFLFNIFLKLRPVLRWVTKLRSSPRAIAGGLALGTCIAFSPTYGIQIFLALILATMFGVNRAASLIPVWITNPVTIAPVYTFNYWVGGWFWSGPPVSEVSVLLVGIVKNIGKLKFWEVGEQLRVIFHLSGDILIPLFIGSLLVGLILGALVYAVTLPLLNLFLKRRRKKRILESR